MLAVEFNARTALINLDHVARGGGASFTRTCAEAFSVPIEAIAGVKMGGADTVYPPSYVAFRKDKFADSACELVVDYGQEGGPVPKAPRVAWGANGTGGDGAGEDAVHADWDPAEYDDEVDLSLIHI